MKPLVFKGNFINNKLSGDGIMSLSNGQIVYGQFQNDILKDTLIQIKYVNGDIYVGQHKNGVKQGKGVLLHRHSGVNYTGDFKDNQMHGQGTLVYTKENNATFTGTFEEDECLTGEYKDSLGNVFRSEAHP